MDKKTDVVIRQVGHEWQVATMFYGLYNTIVGCGTYGAAVRYAEDACLSWSRY